MTVLGKHFLNDCNILLLEEKLVLNLHKNLPIYAWLTWHLGLLILFRCMLVIEPVKFPILILRNKQHCVKSVGIRSYSSPHFPAFGLNMERYSVYLCILSECRKMRTRITPNTDTFHAVQTCKKQPCSN